MQTAPCIPREFLRIELSTTPRSRCLILVLVIRSSRKSSRPSPLIMFDARLSEVSFEESLMMFLTAYIPWSVMALSASYNFSKGRLLMELESAIIELMPRRKVYKLMAFEFLTFLFRSSSLKIFALSTEIKQSSVMGVISDTYKLYPHQCRCIEHWTDRCKAGLQKVHWLAWLREHGPLQHANFPS